MNARRVPFEAPRERSRVCFGGFRLPARSRFGEGRPDEACGGATGFSPWGSTLKYLLNLSDISHREPPMHSSVILKMIHSLPICKSSFQKDCQKMKGIIISDVGSMGKGASLTFIQKDNIGPGNFRERFDSSNQFLSKKRDGKNANPEGDDRRGLGARTA
jgi:hypothetical protein